MAEKSPNPLVVQQSVGFDPGVARVGSVPRRRRSRPRAGSIDAEILTLPAGRRRRSLEPEPLRAGSRLQPLVHEWLQDQRVLGRSPRTIQWYRQKLDWYLGHSGAQTLEELTASELKRFIGESQERGLTDESVRGHFSSIRAFANWAQREGYVVDPAILRVRAPSVAQKEMETFSQAQIETLLRWCDRAGA